MLRIVQNSQSQAAKNYYSSADYYTEGQELEGIWGGKGAELLGLNGVVQKTDFDSLCDNLHPQTQERLTAKTQSNRTVGYDFNFHVPKSVSLAYAIGGDERILDAFRQSVSETMSELETEAQTRVRKGNANTDRTVGNLVWSEFIHSTSRPVNNYPDPHLHAHCFVQNAVFDPIENEWKAGNFKNLKRDAPYYEAAFHVRLAGRLKSLGYNIERNTKGWEIAGLSKSTLDKFSRRTTEIEELAAEKGITDPDQKSALGAKTRKGKAKQYSWRELKQLWNDQLSTREKAQLAALSNPSVTQSEIVSPSQAWQYSLDHCFERASVVSEKTILREALRRGVGDVTVDQIKAQARDGKLIIKNRDGQDLATMKAVLAEEKFLLDFAKNGRGTCKPLNATWKFKSTELDPDQKRALNQLLNSKDRVMILSGRAGTGKTTTLDEFRNALRDKGIEIHAFAPSATASRGVQRSKGFDNADTIARLIVDLKMQQGLRNGLIWVDEAGLVGTKTLKQVFEIAQQFSARVLLTGDKTQHSGVERGDALKLLEEQAGLKPAKLEIIHRQTGKYREAVKRISKGEIAKGYELLDEQGFIHEIPDRDARERQLACDYVDSLKKKKTSLVISPTHAEGDRVTAAIRAEMQKNKLLSKDSKKLTRYESLGWTPAQRSDRANYQAGDMIQFEQNARGHRKGERIVVGDKVPAELLKHAERFQVYRTKELELAKGDLVRITLNGKSEDGHRLNNGTVYRLAGWTKEGDLKLANGWIIDREWRHIQHGYCITSHASQGQTVEQVFVAQSAQSWPATNKEQFYVSVSRGTKSVRVYTDSKEELLEHISTTNERLAATELMMEKPHLQQRRRWWQRLWQWREALALRREPQPQLQQKEQYYGR